MSKSLKLGIDIDGVLARFENKYADVINLVAPNTIPPDYLKTGPKDWNWSDVLSSDVADAAWKIIKTSTNWWTDLPPFEDNVTALRRFIEARSLSVEVYYVTSRVPSAGRSLLEQCSLWLDAYGLLKRYTAIIPVNSGKLKGDVYRALGVTYSIDDRDENVISAAIALGNNDLRHKAYVLDRPYNRDLGWPYRVTTMQEFLDAAWANHVTFEG